MQNKLQYFKFYSNCKFVKGVSRSTICDLQYGEIHIFPNDLEPLINAINKGLPISEIKKKLNDDGVEKFLNFFCESNLGFYTELPHLFPELEEKWEYPGLISNAIIDFDNNSNHPLNKIVIELENVGCQHVQLRFFNSVDNITLKNVLSMFKDCSILSIDLVLIYSDQYTKSYLKDLYVINPRISSIGLFNYKTDKVDYNLPFVLAYFKRKIVDETSCGLITEKHFSSNIKLFYESLKFNSCLNKKISIDRLGNIKNCPSMKNSYGNIHESSIITAANQIESNIEVKITKSKIKVCNVCEFRMVCTDCRAYVEDTNDSLSKPLKCGYNPYENKWENWSENKTKQEIFKKYIR